jgi:hypothetical protein
MKKTLFYACLFLIALFTQPFSSADVVTLKNGRSLEGEILEGNDTAMTLRTKIGKVVLNRGDVASEEYRELPEGFFGAKAEERPRVTVNPTPLRAEGYGEASAAKYKLNVSAEMRGLNSGDAILMKYKTNLPPKTILFLEVKAFNKVLVTRKQSVEGPTFAVRFGPFEGKRFAPGIYVVDVSCIPSRQEDEEIKKKLVGIGNIVATAEIRVGSPEETEEVTGKHKKELIADLKALEVLYNRLNTEYESQEKDFDDAKWESFSDDFKKAAKNIRDFDLAYRKSAVVMDYEAQENTKLTILDTLEKLQMRYVEALSGDRGLVLKPSISSDNRDIAALNKAIEGLFFNIRVFTTEPEKKKP